MLDAARHIQRWTRTLTKQELEYFALHIPIEPWKKLADIVHFNPTKDFPALTWFLPFCFDSPAPSDTMVSRCRHLTNENINELIKEFKIPYSHLKQFKNHLNDHSKVKIVSYEEKLDTILWYYKDLNFLDINNIISERSCNGEKIILPYCELMERLLFFQTLGGSLYATTGFRGRYGRRRGGEIEDQQVAHSSKSVFYSDLLLLKKTQL